MLRQKLSFYLLADEIQYSLFNFILPSLNQSIHHPPIQWKIGSDKAESLARLPAVQYSLAN